MKIIGRDIIKEAARKLLSAAPADSRVAIFGSQARESIPGADVDFLVVEPEVHDTHSEMIRLARTLRPLRIPADVLVLSESTFQRWRHTPNTIPYRICTDGVFL